jgi:hypothetical protein
MMLISVLELGPKLEETDAGDFLTSPLFSCSRPYVWPQNFGESSEILTCYNLQPVKPIRIEFLPSWVFSIEPD